MRNPFQFLCKLLPLGKSNNWIAGKAKTACSLITIVKVYFDSWAGHCKDYNASFCLGVIEGSYLNFMNRDSLLFFQSLNLISYIMCRILCQDCILVFRSYERPTVKTYALLPPFDGNLTWTTRHFRIFNNYSSSPNGLRVNSLRGRRPNGLLTLRPWGREE